MARARRRRVVVLVAVVAVVAAGAVWSSRDDDAPVLVPRCTATVGGESTSLTPEQAANSATIVGAAVRRGLPARAATIAIATAIQESGLRNLDYGDRDSLGLFQQRPSQGWGTEAQVQDPVYATNAFYDGLVEVDGYRDMAVTDAAQAVQRSGFPLAYGDHEQEGRLVASALTGYTPGGFTCRLQPAAAEAGEAGDDENPVPRAAAVRDALAVQVTPVAARVVPGTTGHGLEYDLGDGADAVRTAWAVAGWAVASAERYGITEVSVDGSRWTRTAGGAWRTTATGVPPGGVQVRVAE
ncbi:hypothetical protein [Kineococcus siccus]|uniref:hypothetical protein n=1 Tax=Kineococcus siccus TaxID=2696567 RepID=UPI003B83A20C